MEYLIQNSLDVIYASDEDGKIIEFNSAAQAAFGYTKEEILSNSQDILYANQEEYTRVIAELEANGVYRGEVLNKRKNGELFTCFLMASTLYDENGAKVGSMGVSHDISAQKALEQKKKIEYQKAVSLVEEFKMLSRIATSITNGIVVTDTRGRIKWCNNSFERISGYTLSEMKGCIPSEMFRVPHFFEDEFSKITAKRALSFDEIFQIPHYRKNGELYWILVEATPVYDNRGKLLQVIEVCTEITDHKKTELALVESEQNFRQISETITDVFFLYSILEERYEFISPNSQVILGAPPHFFYQEGAFMEQFVLPEDRYIIRSARMEIFKNESYNIEYRIKVEEKIRWIHERSYSIKDEDGRIIKRSGICRDITYEKETRELLAFQNKAISESIHYAKRIQDATIADEGKVHSIFKDSFIIYEPKDTLSGDFYVMDFIRTNSGVNLKAFVVGDCTGHGVPGAILSILCSSLVKQSLTNHDINSPAEALNNIRMQLDKLFTAEAQVKDGMDIAFCVLNEKNLEMTFSGANMPCFILRGDEWIKLEGDRQHVGFNERPSDFSLQRFQCETGDRIYLFSDGFPDQFGGQGNKRYKTRTFLNHIRSISKIEVKHQGKHLLDELASWKGDTEQTDDICVFGLQV